MWKMWLNSRAALIQVAEVSRSFTITLTPPAQHHSTSSWFLVRWCSTAVAAGEDGGMTLWTQASQRGQ